MYEERNLRNEVEELGIVVMEDIDTIGSQESAFAALDAIREHNRQYPQEKLVEMIEAARREASENMAGGKGGD